MASHWFRPQASAPVPLVLQQVQLHRFQTHSARFVTSIIFLDSLAGTSSLTPYSLIVSLLRSLPFNNTITRESLGPCMDNSTSGLFFVSYQPKSCPIEPTKFSIKCLGKLCSWILMVRSIGVYRVSKYLDCLSLSRYHHQSVTTTRIQICAVTVLAEGII